MMKKAIRALNIANFIVILGCGLAWTGLGFELSTRYQDPRLMGLMQALSVIANLIGPLLIVPIAKLAKSRTILVLSDLTAAICCLLIFFIYSGLSTLHLVFILVFILVMLLSGSINSLVLEPYYAFLIEKRDDSQVNLRQGIAAFASFGILGKLVGMTLGPTIFLITNSYTMLLNGFTFLASTLIYSFTLKNLPDFVKNISIRNESKISFQRPMWNHLSNFSLLEAALANSIIFIVVLVLSTKAVQLKANAEQISIYWFGATVCSFSAHFLISRFKKFNTLAFNLEHKCGYIQVIPVIIGLSTSNVNILIFCQWIFSICNPIITNQSRARFYEVFSKTDKIMQAYSLRNILSNLLILTASILPFFISSAFENLFIPCYVFGLIILRWVLAKQVRATELHASI